MQRDPDFEAWVQRAKDVPLTQVVATLGVPLKRQGNELVGPCPVCGGTTDRLQVSTNKQAWLCRGGEKGLDGIGLAMHCQSIEFIEAVELITGEDRPRSSGSSEPRPIDHEAVKAARDIRRDKEIIAKAEADAARVRKQNRAEELFNSARPIANTHGNAYFKARAIILAQEQAEFIRFLPDHPYYEGENSDKTPKLIGRWPAIITLMRNADGNPTGMHCTYLERAEPRKIEVWHENGDGKRYLLNPRKMYGSKGLIWLSPIREVMAIGEGIETTTSWFSLGFGPSDIGIAAAGDLGNLSGASTGTKPHPRIARRSIPNGMPDMARPGMSVPDQVKEIIFLGDADETPENVTAHLLTACRRHVALGRNVSTHTPEKPATVKKWDWNDVLMAMGKEMAA